MFGFVFVFAFFVLMMCLVFVGFYNCFHNCFHNCFYNCTVLMFALLVANWPFCNNKFDLIWFDTMFASDKLVANSPSALCSSCWRRCRLSRPFTDIASTGDAVSWATITSAASDSAVRRHDVTGSDATTIATTMRTRLCRSRWLQSECGV